MALDQIRALPSVEIGDIIGPTFGTYGPLLEAQSAKITSTPKTIHKYGAHPRQQLDVYSPKQKPSTARTKVLIFLYGGGFVMGDKTLGAPPLKNLAHANVGTFFTSNYGITTIVPDYRLAGERDGAQFPSGGEDVAEVAEWVSKNPQHVGASAAADIDLYILANSAGAAHAVTFLLHPDFQATRAKLTSGTGPKLVGLTLLGALVAFPPEANMPPPVAASLKIYFGEDLQGKSGVSLVQAIPEGALPEWVQAGTKILSLVSELDPPPFHAGRDQFVKALKEKFGGKVKLDVEQIKGHNHISTIVALGTGASDDEEWGRRVGEWVLAD